MFARISKEKAGGRVGLNQEIARVGDQDRIRSVLEKLTESLFADPPQFLRAGAFVKKVRDLKLPSSRADRCSDGSPQGIGAKRPLEQSDIFKNIASRENLLVAFIAGKTSRMNGKSDHGGCDDNQACSASRPCALRSASSATRAVCAFARSATTSSTSLQAWASIPARPNRSTNTAASRPVGARTRTLRVLSSSFSMSRFDERVGRSRIPWDARQHPLKVGECRADTNSRVVDMVLSYRALVAPVRFFTTEIARRIWPSASKYRNRMTVSLR